ncbi:hypothetical protein ACVBAX_19765 [Robertmurraya sp. GLU-23]
MLLESFSLYLSLFMAIFLFYYAYWEGIRIANSEGKVYGGTFIFTFVSACIFSGFTYTL